MQWLYGFPDLSILCILMGSSLLVTRLFHMVIHRYATGKIPEDGHRLATSLHESIVMLSSLILTFSLIQVLNDTHTLETTVSVEASQINNLDQLLLRYDDAAASTIRPLLHAYAQSIVTDEWPDLIKGHGSEVTLEKYSAVSEKTFNLHAGSARQLCLYSAAVALIEKLAQSREDRIQTTENKLPIVYWYVIVAGLLAKLITSSLLERGKLSALVMSLQMIALSGMVSLVFIFDQPYQGESGIKPNAINRIINVMQARDVTLARQDGDKLSAARNSR